MFKMRVHDCEAHFTVLHLPLREHQSPERKLLMGFSTESVTLGMMGGRSSLHTNSVKKDESSVCLLLAESLTALECYRGDKFYIFRPFTTNHEHLTFLKE